LLYPAIYYVVYPGQRYRHPIEPEMTILEFICSPKRARKSRFRAKMIGNIPGEISYNRV
jgi:hypothetical protein